MKQATLKRINVGDSRRMKDGTTAYLSSSKRYFIRREPNPDNWQVIEYYTLDKEYIQLAKAECNKCHTILASKHCGDFVSCECGNFVDTDRWMPERHRYGGDVKPINGENTATT